LQLLTLILTCVSRHAIVQAGDRLVSAGGNPVNPLANKTAVFSARDALVSISYGGLAEVGGITTDDWIARRLVGVEEWVPGNRLARPGAWIGSVDHSPYQWLDLGQGLDAIRTGLGHHFENPGDPRILDYPLVLG
jgi:hypothetical protein